MEADLLVAEGFIEPHFFAGFSGGRKSILPGIASRKTVIYNHNAEFIASDRARTGIVDGNPIHIDMPYAARAAHLAFICNVVINSDKEVIYAVSGDVDQAHIAGREFLSSKCKVDAVMSDIVISTNGGYPLDQNIYQAVKGMTAAEGHRQGGRRHHHAGQVQRRPRRRRVLQDLQRGEGPEADDGHLPGHPQGPDPH